MRVGDVAALGPAAPAVPGEVEVSFLPLEAIWHDERFDASRMILFDGQVASYNFVRDGDVLVPKVSPTFSHGRVALAHGLVNGLGLASSEVFVLQPRHQGAGRFLQYRLRAIDFRRSGEAEQIGVAGLKRVPSAFLRRTPIDGGAWLRRDDVVYALDADSERVSRLRSKLEQLRAKAMEPALAAAERAWEGRPLGRIGYAFEVQLGKKLYEDRIAPDTAKPYLRIANVQWDRFDLSDVKSMNFEGAEIAQYELRPGDLLVCEGRGLGRSAVWDGQITPCYFQMSLNRVRALDRASTRWVMWCLRVLNRRGSFLGDAPGIPHVTAEQLRATRIPLPDPDTQRALVAEIDAHAERAMALDRLAVQLDQRLAEYRDSLITEAVTGQLDVTAMSDAQLDERAHAAMEGSTA